MSDRIIRKAKIVDGPGDPWFRGNVAVAMGSIAAVGRVTEEATWVIDTDQDPHQYPTGLPYAILFSHMVVDHDPLPGNGRVKC